MKRILSIIIILLVIVFGVVFAKNIIAGAVIKSGVKAITGLELRISHVDLGLLKPYFGAHGVKILNPPGFKEELMADIPEIYADYDLGGFFKGKTHFKELRVNLGELMVITSESGQVNVKSLKAFLPKGGGKPPELQIDLFDLKIGKVIYKNYLLGREDVKEFDINLQEKFKNVNDPKALVSLILVKALSKTNIPGLAGIDLTTLKEDISKALIQEIQGTILEKIRSIF